MHKFPERLLTGYHDFATGRGARERQRYEDLARDGQAPATMVIACSDSRVAPETIFDAGPGELFVLRNVANLVPPYTLDGSFTSSLAAIEFAAHSLKISDLVVMGHSCCGGIKAALDPDATPLSEGDFIGKWMGLLKPVAGIAAADPMMNIDERRIALERASILNSISNLRGFPGVEELEAAGKLVIHGVWFDISTGELWLMEPDTGAFKRAET